MSDELDETIRVLREGGDDEARAALAEIADAARREPGECAAALSRALGEESAAGGLRTPRLLTLLGLTREAVPECVPLCLDVLRGLAAVPTALPTDAALGAGAVVACTQPRALLPDLAAIQAGTKPAQEFDRELAKALQLLLAISSEYLRQAPESEVTDMARRLWHDCAAQDLMTLVDFVCMQVERSGTDDPLVALLVDLVERVPAAEDQKSYAASRVKEAGVGDEVVGQLWAAWRAARVAPSSNASADAEAQMIADPEPPEPDTRADEWLVAFAEGDDNMAELARAHLDGMFDDMMPPPSLAWWTAVTVDALPSWRRRDEIEWAMVRIGTTLRKHGERQALVPPSLLTDWLDTPQLLNEMGTLIALDLLSRQQPGVVVRRYLQRVVLASGAGRAKVLAGGLWGALAAAEPAAVLAVASRWLAFGFGQSSLVELLLDLLGEQVRARPALAEELDGALTQTPDATAEVIEAALEVLDQLRRQPSEDQPS